jgi:hypothetical protein
VTRSGKALSRDALEHRLAKNVQMASGFCPTLMQKPVPKHLHASVRAALHQAWELDDAEKAERLLRNLARRLEQVAPGVSTSILEGLDEMLTVIRLGLPSSLGWLVGARCRQMERAPRHALPFEALRSNNVSPVSRSSA